MTERYSERFTFNIYLKGGEVRTAQYEEIIHVLALSNEEFLCSLLSEPLPETALSIAEILQNKFFRVIQKVIVYQDGMEI